jgi:hypothetical protein
MEELPEKNNEVAEVEKAGIKDPSKNSLYLQALLLSKVVTRVLDQRGGIQLSTEPEFRLVHIVEFMKRMRVWSLDKFRGKTFISVINFYMSDEDMENHKATGAVIVYIGEEYVMTLLKKLGYPELDEDNEEMLEDACGTFLNIVSAKFKEGMIQLGYRELVMSHFVSFQNEAINGIEYDPKQKEKYEISFEIGGYKRIVFELTMGNVPRV